MSCTLPRSRPDSPSLSEAELPSVLSAPDVARYRRIFALQDRQFVARGRRRDRHARRHAAARPRPGPALRRPALPGELWRTRELARALCRRARGAGRFYALALTRRPEGAAPPTKPVGSGPAPPKRDRARHRPRAAGRLAGSRRRNPHRRPERAAARRADARRPGGTAAARQPQPRRAQDRHRRRLSRRRRGAQGARHERRRAERADEATDHWQAGLAAWRPNGSTRHGSISKLWRIAGQSVLDHLGRRVLGGAGRAQDAPAGACGLLARHRRRTAADILWPARAPPPRRRHLSQFRRRPLHRVRRADRDRRPMPGGARLRSSPSASAAAPPPNCACSRARSDAAIVESLAALADRANLPGLSLQLAGVLADGDGRNHDYALYPVPRWTPHGGFTVDRALLFALMRQESLFLPRVKSNAGAYGLMQLMPATARSMAEQTGESLGERRRRAAEQSRSAIPSSTSRWRRNTCKSCSPTSASAAIC